MLSGMIGSQLLICVKAKYLYFHFFSFYTFFNDWRDRRDKNEIKRDYTNLN